MSGAFKFKDNSGNIVGFISSSNSGAITISGSALDLSKAGTLNLGSSFSNLATTGSNSFVGQQTVAGNIIPSLNSIYDLGDASHQFRHLYLSSASLYIDGTKVLGSTAQELQITTDVGQSFKILETNSDTITLQSADGNITLAASGGGDVILDPTNGVIALKGTVTMYTGNKIVSSDGNSIHFGNGIIITGSILSTGTSLVSGSSQITYSGLTGVPSGIISGSAQLTGSYDSRYVLSGSITQTTWDNIANKPTGIASGSIQIDLTATTNYTTFSSSISNSINSLSASVATTTSGLSSSIGSLSSSVSTTDAGIKMRLGSLESASGSYATTGSNTFNGSQTITGSLYISQNLIVQGSSSLQDITGSNVYIGTNKINLNTATPAIRFGGISVFDSGSNFGESGSLLWDSVNNRWLYQHPITSGAPYKSAILISGPKNSGSLGSEVGLTTGMIMKSVGDDHIGDSIITETNSGIGISGSLSITGSIISTVTPLVSGSSQISYTGITNIPSGIISGSSQLPNGFVSGSSQISYTGITNIPSGIISGSSQLPSGIVSSSAQTIANLPAGTVSGSAQVSYVGLSNIPSGIISGSAQLPSGLVSGSSQISYTGITNVPSNIVSGSSQIINLGFATTSSVITASSVRNVDTFTATTNQSTFTSSQGYSVGLMDVYVNGSKLAAADYVATNGTTVVLNVAAEGGETVELYAYFQALNSNNALRTITTATATASQTVFTGITYTQGLIEVYYNGSRLSASEYTATNGTSVTLSTAANVGDILDFIAYNYTVGAFVGLSGTGTANYLPKYASTSSLTNSSIIDNSGAVTINGTLVVTGTTLVSGSSQISYTGLSSIPSGIVSGSAQIPSLLPSGVVSGSAQTIANLPSGTVSGSVQVDVMSTTNIARLATTGSNTFQGNQTVNGSLVVTGSLTAQQFIVSSSVTYLTESFASGSHKFGDSADDYHNFTGSVYITGSLTTSGATSTFLNFVSIGTTSSLYPLAVYASTTQTSIGLMSGYSNVAARNWGIATNALTYGDFNLMQSTANGGDPFSAGSSKLYFSPAGYAGINKTTPNTQLDVNGNALVTGSLSTTGNISAGTTINWNGSIGALSYGSGFVTIETNTANAIQLKTNGTTAITISTGQTVTFSNNLVVGSNFQIDAAGDFYQKTTGAGQISAAIANVTYPTFGFYGNTGVGMYRESADTLAFVTSATKRFSISSAGAITAGSAVAATNVEFNLNGVSGKAKRIQFQSSATNQWLLGQGAASETSAFELYNASGTIVISVDKTTNVLTFNGPTTFTTKTNGNNISLSSNGTAMEMYNTSGTVRNWQISSQVVNSMCMDFTPSTANGGTTYSTPVLTIDGEQNRVGIGTGTSRPTANGLTIYQGGGDQRTLLELNRPNTPGLQTAIQFTVGGSIMVGQIQHEYVAANQNHMSFSLRNSGGGNFVSMWLQNDGNVGVGTTSPSQKLDVNGNLNVSGGVFNLGSLWTYTQVGTCTGQSNFNFDVPVGDEGGGGNIFKVEAGFAHYYSMAYNCLAEFYISCRGVSSSATDVVRYDSAYGGSFTGTKSDASTLRVTKNAGNYPGGGRYWIRVTKVTY